MPDPREPTLAAPMEPGIVRRRQQRLLSAGEVFLKKYRTEIAASASSCVSTFIAVSKFTPSRSIELPKVSRARGVGG